MKILNPAEIYKSYQENKLDKKTLIKTLIHIIENESDELLRDDSLKILEDLNPENEEIFNLLENIVLTDWNVAIKIRAIKWLLRDFPKKCFTPIKSLERKNAFPVLVFDLIWNSKNPVFDNYKKELFSRIENNIQEHVSDGIVYEDAIVLVLMEELFKSKLEKINYDENVKKVLNYRDMLYHYNINEEGHILGFYFRPHSDPYSFDFIPESISQLKYLEEFCMSNSSLDSIPETFGELKRLKSIIFSTNRIQSIPNSIGNLTSLEELFLDYNQIRSIPNSIGNLTSLNILDLSGNKIKTIPESIGNLKSIKNLYLSENKIKTIPTSIENLTTLEILDLSYNQIETFPKPIDGLLNLKKLRVGGNLF